MLTNNQFHNKFDVIRNFKIVSHPGVGADKFGQCDLIDVNGNGEADFMTWETTDSYGVKNSRSYNSEPVLTPSLRDMKALSAEENGDVLIEEGSSPEDAGYFRVQVQDRQLIQSDGRLVQTIGTGTRDAREDMKALQSLDVLDIAREGKTGLFAPEQEYGEGAFFAVDLANAEFLIARPKVQ